MALGLAHRSPHLACRPLWPPLHPLPLSSPPSHQLAPPLARRIPSGKSLSGSLPTQLGRLTALSYM